MLLRGIWNLVNGTFTQQMIFICLTQAASWLCSIQKSRIGAANKSQVNHQKRREQKHVQQLLQGGSLSLLKASSPLSLRPASINTGQNGAHGKKDPAHVTPHPGTRAMGYVLCSQQVLAHGACNRKARQYPSPSRRQERCRGLDILHSGKLVTGRLGALELCAGVAYLSLPGAFCLWAPRLGGRADGCSHRRRSRGPLNFVSQRGTRVLGTKRLPVVQSEPSSELKESLSDQIWVCD